MTPIAERRVALTVAAGGAALGIAIAAIAMWLMRSGASELTSNTAGNSRRAIRG